jgi:NADH:ubiquinone reductase (H+-translocating)
MQQTTTKILIIGGGFAGVYTAMTLEKLLKGKGSVEVGLISKENYMVFQPMLPEVISGSIGIVDTIVPIRRLCPKTNLYTREVESIDLVNRTVSMSAGVRPQPYHLSYDHLIIAVGNVTSFAGHAGLAEHAIAFKNLGDALTLRNRVIHFLEEADIEADPDLRRALLTFVVAGGGFSGVEAVAELNDFVRAAARDFRRIKPDEIRVILLHAGGLILPELPENLASFAQKLLQRRGVEIHLNKRLIGATAESALLDGGDLIPTKTLVSTVPAAPNPLVASLPCKKERGRIVVDKFLEVLDYPGVWALGDCAWVVDHNTWQPCPPTAQHATRQATCLAKNLVAGLHSKPKLAFAFKALGKLASLGHRSAVAEVAGFKLSGFPAWLLWRAIYLMKMPNFDRKVRVSSDWLLDLLLPRDIVQLKIEKSTSFGRAHFEPREVIFRQGDRGDLLYIVVDGEVEMVKQEPGQADLVLGRLGPGECFGEMALVNENARMATARTLTGVNVLTIDREAFNALFAYHAPLRGMFQQLIDKRLQDASGVDEALIVEDKPDPVTGPQITTK